MSVKPNISIVVPVFNVQKYLPRCLESISQQSFANFECILVDDGSNDGSLDICLEYSNKDSRFRVISIPNSGPSAARNAGLRMVTSKWVTFIDSDDYVTKDYLANFLKYNKQKDNIQIIQGYNCEGFNGIDSGTLYPSSHFSYTEVTNASGADYIESNNLMYNWGVWCKIFSSKIIFDNNIWFDENLKCGEDGLFWHTYLSYIDKIIYIPEVGYTYFCPQKHTSISRSIDRQPNLEGLISLTKNYKHLWPILSKKFNLKRTSSQLLKLLYLNNYYKALSKINITQAQKLAQLKLLRPHYSNFGFSTKEIVMMTLNVLPLKIVIYLLSKR